MYTQIIGEPTLDVIQKKTGDPLWMKFGFWDPIQCFRVVTTSGAMATI